MILDQHQVSRAKIVVQATGGVGEDQSFDAQALHHADGKPNLRDGVTFIVMGAPLQHKHLFALELPDDQATLVPGDC